ncbi:hypothetical protein GF402_04745 [Candidatus Fermentibacteria bacterium]|nr:hypothetical protein [Candidatus Fermentibacteria bacterium]
MKPLVFLVSLMAVVGITGCGKPAETRRQSREEETLTLEAGKGCAVVLPVTSDMLLDTLQDGTSRSSALISIPPDVVALSALVIPDNGPGAESRLQFLSESGIEQAEIVDRPGAGDGTGVELLTYATAESSVVERLWPRGANEALVCRAKMGGRTPGLLLSYAGPLLEEARYYPWSLERGVRLSDRDRDLLELEMQEVDVSPPPEVSHDLLIDVVPSERRLVVIDTLRVDFAPTGGDSQLIFYVPGLGEPSSGRFQALRGSVRPVSDSAVCIADSTLLFEGLYERDYQSFNLDAESERYGLRGQVRLTSSFCCGAWFYPGVDVPADYTITITRPNGLDVYVPLTRSDEAGPDTSSRVVYRSREGGVRGPVAWVVGPFESTPAAGGRSTIIHRPLGGTDEEFTTALRWTETLAEVTWDNLGFDGARLDVVLVESLDRPVLQVASGCLVVSPRFLRGLAGYDSWPDSLLSGNRVDDVSVVARAASAMLLRSTYLDPSLRSVLCSWAVYLFYDDLAESPDKKADLLEAYRRYYLYSTEQSGGVEHALADPLLLRSDLAEPVLLGKGPLVMTMLERRVPRLRYALPRALSNLRHSGNSYLRLFSALRLQEGEREAELYWKWLFYPGVPQIRVGWSDSASVLILQADQYQPGRIFPVYLERVEVDFADGSSEILELDSPGFGGRFTAGLPEDRGKVWAIDLNPDEYLPVDFIYERIRRDED